MVGFIETCDQHPHKFNFRHFYPEDLNLKFRSKFNHGFTNHGFLSCADIKDLFGNNRPRGKTFKMLKVKFLKS